MLLQLLASDPLDQTRLFLFEPSSLEVGLDLLSTLVAKGETLLEVRILDESKAVSLPIDAFDGQPLLQPIQQLEKQWQALLSKPVNWPSIHTEWLRGSTRRQYRQQQTRIDQLTQVIETMAQRRHNLRNSTHSAACQARVLYQLNRALTIYHQLSLDAQARQTILLRRLAKLG